MFKRKKKDKRSFVADIIVFESQAKGTTLEDCLKDSGHEPMNILMEVQKSGRSYKARCPFHEEKSPSFTLDTEKHLYYCFGCGQAGVVEEVREVGIT